MLYLTGNRSKRELAQTMIINSFFAICKSSSCIVTRSRLIQPLHHTARARSPIINKRAPLHFSDSVHFGFRFQFAKFGIVKRILYIIILKFEIVITTYYIVCMRHPRNSVLVVSNDHRWQGRSPKPTHSVWPAL